MKKAIDSNNRAAFDKLMHSGQDSFNPAHSDPVTHVVEKIVGWFTKKDPDKPSTYPVQEQAMQNWTKAREAEWKQARALDAINAQTGTSAIRVSSGK